MTGRIPVAQTFQDTIGTIIVIITVDVQTFLQHQSEWSLGILTELLNLLVHISEQS